MNHDVPVQSLIDHIKTATDVDPWAKEMVEELLKDQETTFRAEGDGYADGEMVFDEWYCASCGYHFPDDDKPKAKYCPECGRKFAE